MPRIERKYLDDYYEKQMSRLGTGEFTLYGSKLSQLVRFERLTDFVDLRGKTLLDVGCGICEFYDFLKGTGVELGGYIGTEIMESVYAGARKVHPELDVRLLDIVEEKIEYRDKFDVVIAMGVSAIKLGSVENSDAYWKKFVEKMFELTADSGVVAFTCFSNKKSDVLPEDYVADPNDWFNFAMRLTDRVIIDHSYMPHDFTLYLFKGDSKWKEEWKKKGGWNHV